LDCVGCFFKEGAGLEDPEMTGHGPAKAALSEDGGRGTGATMVTSCRRDLWDLMTHQMCVWKEFPAADTEGELMWGVTL
jgi:hypothetical protein